MRSARGAALSILGASASACSLIVSTSGLSEEDRPAPSTSSETGTAGSDAADGSGGFLDAPGLVNPNGFAHRRAITIDRSRVAGDLTGFPVLVSIPNDPTLRGVNSGGGVAHASGYDISFTDADGTTPLPHDLEQYDSASGSLIAWVRIPVVSASKDTSFYLYYGKTNVASPTAKPLDVWDESYVGLWHLDETTGIRRDSARNGNHLSEVPAPIGGGGTEAMIGGSAQFAVAKKERLSIDETKQTGLDVTGSMTISLWARTTTVQPGWRNLIAKWAGGSDVATPNDSYYLALDVSGTGQRIKLALEDASGLNVMSGQTVLAPSTWYYLAAVYDGAAMQVYLNGVADAASVTRANGARSSTSSFDVGNKATATDYGHDGQIDEVRIARVARAPAWLRTEWNNQSAPKTFLRIGAEENMAR